MLTPISGDTAELYVDGRWVLEMFVGDDDGYAVGTSPTVTVVAPGGSSSSPTVESLGSGYFRASVTVDEAGRYVATATAAGYGSTAFTAYASATTDEAGVTLAAVKAYLGTTSTSDAVIQDALDAETAAQRKVCRIPAVYEADLAQALKRRVARNLALRGIPMAVLRGDAESGSLIPPGRDPEVRRLEGPYRKLVQP